MVKIVKIADVRGVDEKLADYIKDKLRNLTEEYQVESIEEFGAIFLVESEKDLEDYRTMGFYKPISESLAEYITEFSPSPNKDGSAYIEACYVFSDGYGVIVIGKEVFFKRISSSDTRSHPSTV